MLASFIALMSAAGAYLSFMLYIYNNSYFLMNYTHHTADSFLYAFYHISNFKNSLNIF